MTQLRKGKPRPTLASIEPATGLEAGVSQDDHVSLKLWLRLLACSTDIETEIKKRLRSQFDITLARFDYLAQLHRHQKLPGHEIGMRMNELSRNLMVTGGNVTGLTDQLVKDGLVSRTNQADDRRVIRIALTAKGRKNFEAMARVHESWVLELLGGVSNSSKKQLYLALGQLRDQLRQLKSKPERQTKPTIRTA